MKYIHFFIGLLLPCSLLAESGGEILTDLQPGQLIQANGKILDIKGLGHASPYIYDFDGDGKRDLLVGEFGSEPFDPAKLPEGASSIGYRPFVQGRLRIYRNLGTNKTPQYGDFKWFMAGGEIAAVPITCCVSFVPQFVDFNGDAIDDVITGSFNGELYFFKGLGKGKFAAGEFIKDKKGQNLKIGKSATVTAYDYDQDGDLDLLTGSKNKKTGAYGISLYVNEGGCSKPQYAVKGKDLNLWGSHVVVADWDNDGLDDLVMGNEGGSVAWFQNIGKVGAPKYGEKQYLIKKSLYSNERPQIMEGQTPLSSGGRTKVHIVDYNSDGKLDILLGDISSHTKILEPLNPEEKKAKAAIDAKFKALYKEYQPIEEKKEAIQMKVFEAAIAKGLSQQEAIKALSSADVPNDLLESLKKRDALSKEILKELEKFRAEEESVVHGFVWLYLRK